MMHWSCWCMPKYMSSLPPSGHTAFWHCEESWNMFEPYCPHCATAFLVEEITEWLHSNRHYLPSEDGEESTTLSRSPFQEKELLTTKDRIVQVYGTICELVTPSLVRCILTAGSLCCSLYSHRFVRWHKLPASDLFATNLFGGNFVWRKSVKCSCTNPTTFVTAVFGGKLRRRHEWSLSDGSHI